MEDYLIDDSIGDTEKFDQDRRLPSAHCIMPYDQYRPMVTLMERPHETTAMSWN